MCNVIYMTYTLLCDSKVIEKIITSYLSGYKKVNDDNPDFFIVEDSFLKIKGFTVKSFFEQNLDSENVLFITSSTSQELLVELIQSRGQASGKTRYILKPFDKDGLMEKVEQLTS